MVDDMVNENAPSKCVKYKNMFAAYIDNELDDATKSDLLNHLNGCLDCRRELDTQKEMLSLLRGQDIIKANDLHISEKRRRNMMWLMGHPFLSFCYIHHKKISLFVSLSIIIIILLALLSIKLAKRPDVITVDIVTTEQIGEKNLPELEEAPVLNVEAIKDFVD